MKKTFSVIAAFIISLCIFAGSGAVYAEPSDSGGQDPKVQETSEMPEGLPDNGIPVISLTIDQAEFQKVLESGDHSYKAKGASIHIYVPEDYQSEYAESLPSELGDLPLKYFRGRGNSTWQDAKKPFKLKLKTAADLLGMGESSEWALLANSYDVTLLRNRLMSYLGNRLGMEYTPKMTPVDLVVNEKFYGSYVLSELVEIGPNRVDIDVLTREDNAGTAVTGGYLVAMSPEWDEDPRDVIRLEGGLSFLLDDPSFSSDTEEDNGTTEQRAYIADYLKKLNDAFLGEGLTAEDGTKLSELMDIESAAKYWLVQEFSANADAYTRDSTYLYKKRDTEEAKGKIYWGPLWDFDIAFARPDTEGFDMTKTVWFDRLRAYSPEFQEAVLRNWTEMDKALSEILKEGGLLDTYAEQIRKSREADFILWPHILENPDTGTFDEELTRLRTFLSTRQQEFQNGIKENLDKIYANITCVADGKPVKELVRRIGEELNEYELPENTEIPKEGYGLTGWLDENGKPVEFPLIVKEPRTLTAQYTPESELPQAKALFFNKYDVWGDLQIGSTDISFTILPEDAYYKDITWDVSDPNHVTVYPNGTIDFDAVGDYTIKGTLRNGVSNSFKLHVYNGETYNPGELKAFIPKAKSISLLPGRYTQMRYSVLPEGAVGSPEYISGNEKIATVDSNGVIFGISPGTCTITMKHFMPNVEARFTVVVKKYANAMTAKGKTVKVKASKLKKKA